MFTARLNAMLWPATTSATPMRHHARTSD
jgi:hypothetical protein